MIINKMYLFASAGLQDIHRRSYKTTITNDALNALDQATNGGKKLSQHAIAQVATNIIAPSAETEGTANIINGWQTPRFRFVMEVLESGVGGVKNLAYYIGHTDYMEGATKPLAGNRLGIDPQLTFFINTIHRLKQQQLAVNGVPQMRPVTDRFSQVLYGKNTIANLHNGGMDEFKIRPIDVFRKQDVLHALSSAGYMDGDIQPINTSGSMLMGAELSTRRNNNPGTYIFDTLNAYNQALNVRDSYGGDNNTMINEAITMSMDSGNEAYQDPFFQHMRDIEQSITYRGQFTWANLMRIAPHIDDVTQVFTPTDIMRHRQSQTADNMFGNTWNQYNTSSWQSADIETVAASLLANSIPTIMLDNMVASLRFTMTNLTQTGEISFTIDNAHSMSEYIDATQSVSRVIERIKMELIPMVSQQNTMGFRLMVDSSVFGDTAIHIAITSPDFRTYVMPTFADNVASPVLTKSMERYNQVTNDLFNLGYQLFERRPDFLQNTGTVAQPGVITAPQSLYS